MSISVSGNGFVSIITLDRPDARNALSLDMRDALEAALLAFDADTTKRVAVLMASHNRVGQTLQCLHAIFHADWPPGVVFAVFLVDDGSTDGTPEAVAQQFPDVSLIRGTGSLYWCNSMRLAWDHAAREDFDFYLWMNDDTILLPGALTAIFRAWDEASSAGTHDVIVVGSCRDPSSGRHTYGGLLRPGRHPARLLPVEPSNHPQLCDTFNGNLVLVPRSVFRRIGSIRSFAHAIGDNDYGLSARAAGCDIVVAAGYQGECAHNDLGERFDAQPLLQRVATAFARKSFPPGSWMRYYWRHARWRMLIYWPQSLAGRLFPALRRRKPSAV